MYCQVPWTLLTKRLGSLKRFLAVLLPVNFPKLSGG